jgi:hypothetical protein
MDNGKDSRPDRIRGESMADACEIDAVLAHASVPLVPEGAVSRLMARIAEEPQVAKVMLFRPREEAPRRSLLRFATALPLAASLALGIYLGSKGTLDFMLPTAITGVAISEDSLDDLGGVGEADDYASESLL